MGDIVQHYGSTSEDQRLFSGIGQLEFARTKELIERRLPPAPATILDVGGGPGAYASWLTRLGYQVHLIDATEKHVNHALRTVVPLASAQVGDARSLPFPDASAAVILLLGPLYHLTARQERIAALREAWRSLNSGGSLFAAAISRFASLLDSLARGFIDELVFQQIVDRDLREGQHRNSTGRPEYFTTAFFHRPDELRAEVAEAGFRSIDLVAVEGPGWIAHDFGSRWVDPLRRAKLLEMIRRVENEPSLLGMSPHFLAVATK
jgi:ubiquinone/menaquinone biosynthesis C-methylase UbiE